jgi:hypothetical protein
MGVEGPRRRRSRRCGGCRTGSYGTPKTPKCPVAQPARFSREPPFSPTCSLFSTFDSRFFSPTNAAIRLFAVILHGLTCHVREFEGREARAVVKKPIGFDSQLPPRGLELGDSQRASLRGDIATAAECTETLIGL